jgi:hypothetical protein
MRYAVGLLLLGACTITTGCAQAQFRKRAAGDALRIPMAAATVSDEDAAPRGVAAKRRVPRANATVLVEHRADDYEEDDYEEAGETPPEPDGEGAIVDDKSPPQVVRQEVLPEPVETPAFRPGEGEVNIDRFTRRLTEVPLDIRNTAGTMPEDVSLAAFPEAPIASVPGPAPGRAEVPVAYSPWTICFRPLYFEEVRLERYGDTHGILQPAISGAHFFGSVVALPYKMTVRPPRSCECSNGFSRPGDCPLPGYGRHELRADAALVEAAVVAGIAVALPW